MRASPPLAPVDALVTGAARFPGPQAGRAHCAHADSACACWCASRSPATRTIAGVQVVIGDLGDPRMVEHVVAGRAHRLPRRRGDARQLARLRSRHDLGHAQHRRRVCRARHASPGVCELAQRARSRRPRSASATHRSIRATSRIPRLRGAYTQTKLAAERIVRAAMRDRGLSGRDHSPGPDLRSRRRERSRRTA